jgi:hypothetical protein
MIIFGVPVPVREARRVADGLISSGDQHGVRAAQAILRGIETDRFAIHFQIEEREAILQVLEGSSAGPLGELRRALVIERRGRRESTAAPQRVSDPTRQF